MRKLVDQAKQSKSKTGVMSLKTLLKSDHQDLVEPFELEEQLMNIQMLEMLGPPDHAIISLSKSQINFLKSTGTSEVFWPSGSEGITCLTHYPSHQRGN